MLCFAPASPLRAALAAAPTLRRTERRSAMKGHLRRTAAELKMMEMD